MVCDIGGTNTRNGLAEEPGHDPILLANVKPADFSDQADCVEHVPIDPHALRPRPLLALRSSPMAPAPSCTN